MGFVLQEHRSLGFAWPLAARPTAANAVGYLGTCLLAVAYPEPAVGSACSAAAEIASALGSCFGLAGSAS